MAAAKYLYSSIVLVSLVIVSLGGQVNSTAVYGVRWFLGEHFTYTLHDDSDNNEYFVLAFNSNATIDGELSVRIGNNRFTCTSEFLSTKNYTVHHSDEEDFTNNIGDDVVDETYLHKCIIGNLRTIMNNSFVKTVNYSITLDNIFITQSTSNPNISKPTHLSLFNSSFRLPYYQSSFQALVIGDWGQIREQGKLKGYADPLPCILKMIEENQNIVLINFTGDLAYDLQGSKYYSMLKYMEPITSRLTLVAAPGNHDTLYHADTFELYTKSYYTPQWWSYSNYFNKFAIGKLLFIFYNPQLEEYDFMHADRLMKNLTSVFETQFTPEVIESIKSSYFPMVFSHYPIYCSDINDDVQSCERNPTRFKAYREYFNKLDMKLYISGHLHVYERSVPICYDDLIYQVNSDEYNMSCPVYIIEGAGGNNAYVQLESEYPPKNFSSSIVYNTGFGILTVNSQSESSYPNNVKYQHISAKNCSVADHFIMTNTALDQNNNSSADPSSSHQYFLRIMLKVGVLSLIVGVLIIICLFIRRRYHKSAALIKSEKHMHQENHVEMVEQNFDAPESDKGNHAQQ